MGQWQAVFALVMFGASVSAELQEGDSVVGSSWNVERRVGAHDLQALREALVDMEKILLRTMSVPWPYLDVVTYMVESGSVGLSKMTTLASVQFGIISSMSRWPDEFYMIYVGFEVDGTFLGYYNEDSLLASKGARGHLFTHLDGASCAWNYTKACGGSAEAPCG